MMGERQVLKSAVEVIPNPLEGFCKLGANPPIDLILRSTFRLHSGRGDRRVRRRTLSGDPFRITATVHTRCRRRDHAVVYGRRSPFKGRLWEQNR